MKPAPVVLKMACGENPKNVYGRGRGGEMPSTRMGSAWMMRKRFEEARAMMKLQNKFCANMTNLTEYVESHRIDPTFRWKFYFVIAFSVSKRVN